MPDYFDARGLGRRRQIAGVQRLAILRTEVGVETTVEVVVAAASGELVRALLAEEVVIAIRTFEGVIADPSVERVIVVAALEGVLSAVTVQGVFADPTTEVICAVCPLDFVISVAAVGRELTVGLDPVVTASAADAVGSALTVDVVVAVVADDHVVPIRAGDLATIVINRRGLAEALLRSEERRE